MASADSESAISTWSSSTKRTGRFIKSMARSLSTLIHCWSGSPQRRRTKSIETLIDCLTLKMACRPITTRLRSGQGRISRAPKGGFRTAAIPVRRNCLRPTVRRRKGRVGCARLERRRCDTQSRRSRGGKPLAFQQRYRGQGAGAPNDARP